MPICIEAVVMLRNNAWAKVLRHASLYTLPGSFETKPKCITLQSRRWCTKYVQEAHEEIQTLKQACCQGYPSSARYVQRSIGSRNSAIHNDYHTSLRPSSLLEPRHPSLKVVRQLSQSVLSSRHSLKTYHGHFHRQQEQAGPQSRVALPPTSST